MVVDRIVKHRVGFTAAEVNAPALVSTMGSHHGHSVISFSQKNTQSIQFSLDGRIPFVREDGFVDGVIESWWRQIKLLFRHHNTSIFSFF